MLIILKANSPLYQNHDHYHPNHCIFGFTSLALSNLIVFFLPDNKFYGSLPSRVRPKRTFSEPSNINNSVDTPRLPMNTSLGDLFQNAVVHRTRGYNEPPPSLSYAPQLFDPVFPLETGSSSASTPQPSPPPPYMHVPASAPPQGEYDTSDRRVSSRSFRRRKGLGFFNFGKLRPMQTGRDLATRREFSIFNDI
jgi:hypothetical protein